MEALHSANTQVQGTVKSYTRTQFPLALLVSCHSSQFITLICYWRLPDWDAEMPISAHQQSILWHLLKCMQIEFLYSKATARKFHQDRMYYPNSHTFLKASADNAS